MPTLEPTGLKAVLNRIEKQAEWKLMCMDRMSEGDAYIFYLRTVPQHRFRNVFESIVTSEFDAWIMCDGPLIRTSSEKAADRIMEMATSELKKAKSLAKAK